MSGKFCDIILIASKVMVNSFWVTVLFGPQCIFKYLYLYLCISIYLYLYIYIYIYLLLFLINVELFQSAQYFNVKLYITLFVKQLSTSDLTLHCVSCLPDNPSDVIFIFSNNFLYIQNTLQINVTIKLQ